MFDISLIAWPGLGAFVGYTAAFHINRYLDARAGEVLDGDPDLAEPVARCVGGRQRHLFEGNAVCQRCKAPNPKWRTSEPVVCGAEFDHEPTDSERQGVFVEAAAVFRKKYGALAIFDSGVDVFPIPGSGRWGVECTLTRRIEPVVATTEGQSIAESMYVRNAGVDGAALRARGVDTSDPAAVLMVVQQDKAAV